MPLPSRPRVVVTGAASGLGRAFCKQLARAGARIVASDVDLAGVSATIAMLDGAEAHAVRCDVSDVAAVEALANEAERLLGGVDLVINNAGVAVGGLVGEVPIESWKWILGVNLWGVIHGCHVFAPRFRRQKSGHILNVGSAAGLLSAPGMAPYNVTKAGVVALSETLRAELAPDGVGVSVLCPTFFQTNIAKSSRTHGVEEDLKWAEKLMSRSKIQADDVARIALDGVRRNELYVVPHRDGRWLWRVKRLAPEGFNNLTPKFFSLRSKLAH